MNYKEKFLEIFSFLVTGKSLDDTKEEDRNGRYVKKEKDGPKKIIWYKNGIIHNDNGPAFIRIGGGFDTVIQWYKEGKVHKDNGPAMITKNNSGNWTEEWYRNGELHRDGDEPAIIDSNENKHWYKNGELHRDNGPAIIKRKDSHEKWYKKGKLHCEDGPAIKAPLIKGFYRDPGEQWWLDGKQVTKDEFDKFVFCKKLEKELPQNNDKPQAKKLKL